MPKFPIELELSWENVDEDHLKTAVADEMTDSTASLKIEFQWLGLNVRNEDEAVRILNATLLIHHYSDPPCTLAQALRTAIIWERG